MSFEDTIKEPWFIGVVAGVGALIIILIVVIIILCCLWFRRKKQLEEKSKEKHDVERDSSERSSYQEITEGQNWMMVQQNGIHSAPASNNVSRQIKGDDPYIAGSSLVKMNEEMQKTSVQSSQKQFEMHKQSYNKTEIERALEKNQNIDAFERKRSDASEMSRVGRKVSGSSQASRFDRESDVRESGRSNLSYQKPRLANVQVSQSSQYESSGRPYNPTDRIYRPERSNSNRTTRTTVYNQTNQSYRIPEEDYSGIEMYRDEERYSWKGPQSYGQNSTLGRLTDAKKVKNLTEKFETTEVSSGSAAVSSSRSALDNEIREQIAGRRFHQGSEAGPASPRRVSQEYQGPLDYTGYLGASGNYPPTNWQGKSGKGTIETRVNRIKKVGAVSVFPD